VGRAIEARACPCGEEGGNADHRPESYFITQTGRATTFRNDDEIFADALIVAIP
jgi:hypothetical protein